MAIGFREIVEQSGASVFFIDASGVIYDDHGTIPGAAAAMAWLQDRGDVFVVTNNTFQCPDTISARLEVVHGISVAPPYILSSGRGLSEDVAFSSVISGALCYVVGSADSDWYVHAAGGEVVSALADADVVVLLASSHGSMAQYDAVIAENKRRPSLTLVCANPDVYVQPRDQEKIPVIGYYARYIDESVGGGMLWMGKPEPCFSAVVDQYVSRQLGRELGADFVFVDDNIDNVRQLCGDLGGIGCVPQTTGLAQSRDWNVSESERIFKIMSFA